MNKGDKVTYPVTKKNGTELEEGTLVNVSQSICFVKPNKGKMKWVPTKDISLIPTKEIKL